MIDEVLVLRPWVLVLNIWVLVLKPVWCYVRDFTVVKDCYGNSLQLVHWYTATNATVFWCGLIKNTEHRLSLKFNLI